MLCCNVYNYIYATLICQSVVSDCFVPVATRLPRCVFIHSCSLLYGPRESVRHPVSFVFEHLIFEVYYVIFLSSILEMLSSIYKVAFCCFICRTCFIANIQYGF